MCVWNKKASSLLNWECLFRFSCFRTVEMNYLREHTNWIVLKQDMFEESFESERVAEFTRKEHSLRLSWPKFDANLIMCSGQKHVQKSLFHNFYTLSSENQNNTPNLPFSELKISSSLDFRWVNTAVESERNVEVVADSNRCLVNICW